MEKDLKAAKLRYATGKIDDDSFQIANQELKSRLDEIILELDKCEKYLSNSSDEVKEIVATCCKLSTLWSDSSLETKQKVQNLVFPNGVFWNKEKCDYRTPEKSVFFSVFSSLLGTYKKETEAETSTSVPLCG